MTNRVDSAKVRNLLVLAPNWLGDAVMMTPLLDFLNDSRNFRQNQSPRITLAIRNTWAPLFFADPRINSLISIDRDGKHGGVRGLLAQARLMSQGNYDAVLLCPPSLRVGLAAWLAKIPIRIGYASDGRSPLLTTALDKKIRGTIHYSQEMVALGQTMLGIDEDSSLNLPTSLAGCVDEKAADLGGQSPVWVMAPGTTYGQAKTWPAHHVANFLNLAVQEKGVRIVLLGDKQTRTFVGTIQSQCHVPWRSRLSGEEGVIDMTGQTGLMDVVAILKSSAAFVGNDSGLMHLAAALGVPTVGLFGSSNPDWTAPLGEKTRALAVPGFPCRPCYRKTCNQTEFCLDKLSAEEVLGALSELVQENV